MENYKNHIKRFREKKGMSQRQLATAVGVSQQQIQRFETGTPVKLDVALMLATRLDTPLQKLFPGSARAVHQIKTKGRAAVLDDAEKENELLEAGIEADLAQWTARVLVRGGDPKDPMLYPIHVADTKRVRHYLPGSLEVEGKEGRRHSSQVDKSEFFVFDATDRWVAVNMEHVIFWQNLFDPPGQEYTQDKDESWKFSSPVNVYLAGLREPMTFDVDEDPKKEEHKPDDEGEDEDTFRRLLFELDSEPAKSSYINFLDVDGERAYFRVGDIAVLEIAKVVTDPELLEEDEDEPEPPSVPSSSAGGKINPRQQVNYSVLPQSEFGVLKAA